jgi:hypothetical protein
MEAGRFSNGLFTYAVLDALRDAKADADGDGRVKVSELIGHVAGRVDALTRGRQRPNTRAANPYLDFDVH